MWQRTSPHTEAFVVLDGIRETHIPQWAFSAQRLRNPDGVLAGDTIREIFGKENLGNILTRRATVSVNSGTEIPVCGLSVLSHKVILLEEHDGR